MRIATLASSVLNSRFGFAGVALVICLTLVGLFFSFVSNAQNSAARTQDL
jgi:cell division protein FtsX